MDLSLKRGERPLSGAATIPHQENKTDFDNGGRFLKIGRSRELDCNFAAEVRGLLLTRLRVCGLFTTCAVAGYVLLFNFPLPWAGNRVSQLLWHDPTFNLLTLIPLVGITAILWSSLHLSLSWLRALELAILTDLSIYFALGAYDFLLHEDLIGKYAEQGPIAMIVLSRMPTLNSFAVIVAYGVFIPNSWRRCFAVGAVLALAPMITSVLALVRANTETRLLITFTAQMAFWMVSGVTLAVFSCHRIGLLRREASQARRLGQYELKQRLGAGGMGEVYLAEHLLLRRPCAIKLIRPDRAAARNELRRFEREVQATAKLTHSNTVEIFDYGRRDDGTFYYVMEYLPGLTLEQLVTAYGLLPPERVVHFLRQVCGALTEAHATGLIHRDIKPNNIVICHRGGVYDVAKLLDFGLVQDYDLRQNADKLTAEGAIAGTPSYMSPEQAGGIPDLDPRSDLYSLGAVAYFLLTGQPPFVRRTSIQVLAAHLHETVRPLSDIRVDVPSDLERVILTCLEKDPRKRFQDADSLEKALAGCKSADTWTRESAAEWWRHHPCPSSLTAEKDRT
jgi:serine/threonine-protein kinase